MSEHMPQVEADLTWARAEIRRLTDLNEAWLLALSELGLGAVISDDTRLLYANQAFCETLGYSLEELLALPSFYQLMPESDGAVVAEMKRRRLQGEPTTDLGVYGMFHKAGHRMDFEVVSKTAYLDTIPHFISVFRPLARV